jgi:hypothetical protein
MRLHRWSLLHNEYTLHMQMCEGKRNICTIISISTILLFGFPFTIVPSSLPFDAYLLTALFFWFDNLIAICQQLFSVFQSANILLGYHKQQLDIWSNVPLAIGLPV